MPDLAAIQYGFSTALASALLHSLWQAPLLAVAAGLTLRSMTRRSAAIRHAVAMAFLIAMLLLPAIQFLHFWQQPGSRINDGLLPAVTAPSVSLAANVFVQSSSPIAAIIVLAWLMGAALMFVRYVAGLRVIAAVERSPYQPLPPEWLRRLDHLRRSMHIVREVGVRVSTEVVAPFTARLIRPIIWLPLSLVTHTPAEQLEALLAHELAHIARKDWLWNGVQCVIEALLFFNPAVWWLGRQIRQEREHACDDLAVAACGDAVALAEALTTLEYHRHPSLRLSLAAQGGSLMKRVRRLLSTPPSRGRWGAIAVLGALTVSGVVMATQIGIAGGFPDMQVRSSTAGVLGPGDFREIMANGLDKQRYYRIDIDAQGRRTEVYQENGQARPIDAGVVRWIDEVSRLAVPPTEAELAKMHEIPESALIEGQPATKALFAILANHPAVVAKLGSPAAVLHKDISGNIRLDDSSGEADVAIPMRGPRGSAIVNVRATLRNRVWTFGRVEVG